MLAKAILCDLVWISFAVTPATLKFNFIASKVKLMNYLIYCEGDIILYYDIYKENK